ncbi:MAG: sterol desaturase family protein [Alphaproteobacteria bacterium]|nr:sterol desaturase family protein [Alphaproteobacteria bacterium]
MMLQDIFQTWGPILVQDFLRYLIAAGGVHLLVRALLAAGKSRRRLAPADPARRQLRREFLWSLSTVAIFSLNGLMIHLLIQIGYIEIYTDPARHGYAHLGASLVLILVAHDTYFYWTHRLLHRPALFARFHRLHHRSRHPSAFAAYSFHPVEAAIQAAFFPLFLLLVPTHVGIVLVFLTHMILRNALGHSGFEFYPAGAPDRPSWRRLTSTTHHHLHHERGSGNFGLYFTWWDRLMGTERHDYRERFARVTDGAA